MDQPCPIFPKTKCYLVVNNKVKKFKFINLLGTEN